MPSIILCFIEVRKERWIKVREEDIFDDDDDEEEEEEDGDDDESSYADQVANQRRQFKRKGTKLIEEMKQKMNKQEAPPLCLILFVSVSLQSKLA